jgi:hypothetical protein
MHIVVETFFSHGETSASPIRVRPLPGQGFDVGIRVECSKAMRTSRPVGQKYLLEVSVKDGERGRCLYASYRSAHWQPLSDQEAAAYIAKAFASK